MNELNLCRLLCEQFFTASIIYYTLSTVAPARETFMDRAVIGYDDQDTPSNTIEKEADADGSRVGSLDSKKGRDEKEV